MCLVFFVIFVVVLSEGKHLFFTCMLDIFKSLLTFVSIHVCDLLLIKVGIKELKIFLQHQNCY